MEVTPNTGETETPGASQTTVQTPATPVVNAVDPAEVERLRKDKEKSDLRVRQLENEAQARKEADEEAKRKQLEENDEWKSLAEQEKAKREALEAEKEADATAKQLKEATAEVFSEFPANVVELAEEMGVGLTDGTDEDKAKLKAQLTKIAGKVVSDKKVTPNNPGGTSAPTDAELMQRMRAGDKTARAEVIGNLPGVQAMRKMAGYSE